jgi:PAS domain S-box-containing protein
VSETREHDMESEGLAGKSIEPRSAVSRNPLRGGHLKIRTRLTWCFIAIISAMLVANLVAVWQLRRTTAPSELLNEADQLSLAAMSVHLDVDTLKNRLSALADINDASNLLKESGSLRRKFLADLTYAQQLFTRPGNTKHDPVILRTLETLKATVPPQIDEVEGLAQAKEGPAMRLRLADQVQGLMDLSALLLERVNAEVSQQRAEALESAQRVSRQLFMVLPLTALLTMLLAIFIGWHVTQTITEPLAEVHAGAQALAHGNFAREVKVTGDDELATVARAFNYAAGRLRQSYGELRNREEALRRSEKELRDVIETIPAMVWSTSPDGAIDFINRRWLEFSGVSLEGGLGWGWEAAVHPDDLARFVDEWRAAVACGKPMETEARVRRADGQYRWLLVRNVPLRDQAGRIVKWYGTSADIDDRKRAEETLREQANLLDLTHDTIFVADMQGVIKYWNRGAEEQYGWTAEQAVGTVVHELLKTVFPKPREEVIAEVTRAGRWEGELLHTRKDGTRIVVACRLALQCDEQGAPVAILESNNDITDRRRAEEERERVRQLEGDLAHLNRVSMMGELTASIAHEVNQPLAGLVSNGSACLRWLAADVPNVEEARENARRIVRDGKRAGEVIARLRALAKRAATSRERLDLNETIQDVLALVSDEATKKSVITQTQFADDLSPVSGDRVQLQQVMLNLLMNAIEAMSSVSDRARELVITTRNIDPDQVQATVEDSGIGIDAQTIDKIFDSFYTTKPGGMGMGLSISSSILQAHGGRLWATANDGPGTSFHFTLSTYHEEGSPESRD